MKNVCFSCGRDIRDWETGFVATGLCEDCQVEAEQQAERDDAAVFVWNEEAGAHLPAGETEGDSFAWNTDEEAEEHAADDFAEEQRILEFIDRDANAELADWAAAHNAFGVPFDPN